VYWHCKEVRNPFAVEAVDLYQTESIVHGTLRGCSVTAQETTRCQMSQLIIASIERWSDGDHEFRLKLPLKWSRRRLQLRTRVIKMAVLLD